MHLIVCAGIHDPQLTQGFLTHLSELADSAETAHYEWLIFPTESYPPYSGPHVLWFVQQQLSRKHPHQVLQIPLIFIGFSAGVVGAIAAAWGWQLLGGTVKAFIAVDGWGMPLWGSFPIHRLSHDYFTHWSSALLGSGEDGFYADPPVAHLDLWRSPHLANGWRIPATVSQPTTYTTAARFISNLLHRTVDSEQ